MLTDYKDKERTVDLVKVQIADGLEAVLINKLMNYQAHAPLQSLMLPMRIALLATEAKDLISCQHIWGITNGHINSGDLFIVKDHANISASSPGIGPNINDYGPRFYDITHMYESHLIHILK